MKHLSVIELRENRSASEFILEATPVPRAAYVDYVKNPEVLADELQTLGSTALLRGHSWPPEAGSDIEARLTSINNLLAKARDQQPAHTQYFGSSALNGAFMSSTGTGRAKRR